MEMAAMFVMHMARRAMDRIDGGGCAACMRVAMVRMVMVRMVMGALQGNNRVLMPMRMRMSVGMIVPIIMPGMIMMRVVMMGMIMMRMCVRMIMVIMDCRVRMIVTA